jgi:glutaredoxin
MYTIITKDRCTFCGSAKRLLDEVGQGYVEYNIETQSSRWIISLLKQSGIKSVPQIFSTDGTHIGGFTELRVVMDSILNKQEGSI